MTTKAAKDDAIYHTSFCNHGHRLSDGVPVNHECYVLNPKALQAEREGNTEKAILLTAGKRIRHRGVKVSEDAPKRTRTKKATPPARRRWGGFLIFEDGEKCPHCGHVQRQTKEDKANGDPAGFYLECPECYRPGCEECMPFGRNVVCPECEEGRDA